MLTYAFSHFSFFSYLFNMIMLASFGRGIQMLFGGIFMQMAMPYTSVVIPQVGADASISALLTFYGLFNLQNSVLFFFFPVRMWVLLGLMGVYCMFEPSKKNLGGMMA